MDREGLLSKLSIRLTHLADSSDKELNAQLEKLRAALRDGLDAAQIERLYDQLAKRMLLKEEESNKKPAARGGNFSAQFARDIKALPVDKAHRSSLAKLADQLVASRQLEDQLATLSEVFQLLRSAIPSASGKKSSSGGLLGWLDKKGEGQSEELNLLLEKSAQMVNQAVQHIDVLNGDSSETSLLREQLEQLNTVDAMVDALEQVIEMLREHNSRIEEERATTQDFLDDLRKRLGHVEEVIVSVVSDGDESLDRAIMLEKEVGDDVRVIGKAAQEDDLDGLKQAVDKGLSNLSTKLSDYLSVEKEGHEKTRQKVTNLNQRLKEMEAEARDLRGQVKEKRDLAVKDALTGVYNRAGFEERIGEEFARSNRSNAPLSLVFVDCNKFKQINDTFGHAAGDTVLVEVASALAGRARASDIVARYGGDEFVVVLPDTPMEGADRFARDASQKILDAGFNANGQPLDVSISCGITQVRPDDTPESALERADEAMYDAKKKQGLRVVSRE